MKKKSDKKLIWLDFSPEEGFESFEIKYDRTHMNNCLDVSSLPFCCGIEEIGNFPDITQEELNYLLHNKKENFAQFTKFLKHCLCYGNTYMINTNNSGFSIFVQEYFETKTGKSLFKKVKSFINSGSGNKVTIYISK